MSIEDKIEALTKSINNLASKLGTSSKTFEKHAEGQSEKDRPGEMPAPPEFENAVNPTPDVPWKSGSELVIYVKSILSKLKEDGSEESNIKSRKIMDKVKSFGCPSLGQLDQSNWSDLHEFLDNLEVKHD